MISFAPYCGVLIGVVCAWIYLRRSVVPVAASGWRSSKIEAGDCPVEHCGGKTYEISAHDYQTLWRCVECKGTWLLSTISGL